MNKLVLVVLSIALIAHFIPSAFAKGKDCITSRAYDSCKGKGRDSKCCVLDVETNERRCRTVTEEELMKTANWIRNSLPTSGLPYLTSVVLLRLISEGADELQLTSTDCFDYNNARLVEKYGIHIPDKFKLSV